jgi:predicted nucleotidyltransferase component of viral defense system
MIGDVLRNRIREYAPSNALEQENVLQELMQHYVLASLSRARLFSLAAFHGGTCLRILYGMNRFSEDLDFILKEPDEAFEWGPYLEKIRRDCKAEGIHFEVQDKSRIETAVRKVFLKTESIGQILNLELPYMRRASKKIRIKLEVDINPPAGATFETRYITFPMIAAITSMTLESGFGSKSHALLCREYTKGRDWYDFLWYSSRNIIPNYKLLANALNQLGPWAGRVPEVTPAWYINTMKKRIEEIDWRTAKNDVARFIKSNEQESVESWSKELFMQQLERLAKKLL